MAWQDKAQTEKDPQARASQVTQVTVAKEAEDAAQAGKTLSRCAVVVPLCHWST